MLEIYTLEQAVEAIEKLERRVEVLEKQLHPKVIKRTLIASLKDWTNDQLQDLSEDEFSDEDEKDIEEVTETLR